MRKIFFVPALAIACTSPKLVSNTTTIEKPSPKPVVAFALAEPAKGITTTMAGDPSMSDLAQARLVPTTCDAIDKDDVESEIAEMKKAVDASFKGWVEQQQWCNKADGARGSMWGDSIGDSFGAGGLGLTGTGEGGGGSGQGFGLGSVGTRSARDFSKTNNQVGGVDEADIVKTDGRWVYLASNGALRIVEAMNPKVLSVTHLDGAARELFVEGNRAVVYSSSGDAHSRCTYGYDCTVGGDGTTTKISVYDVSDRASPKLSRRIDLSGSLIAARRIGNAVHTVVADNDARAPRWSTWPSNVSWCGGQQQQAVVASHFTLLKAQNESAIRAATSRVPTITENGKTTRMCGGLQRTALRDGQAFTSIVSFDLTNDRATPATVTMQSRPGAVFASETGLYMSVVHQKTAKTGWYSYYDDAIDEVSEIHKFRIGASPSDTKYVGSGTIPGHVLNQFAMDEWFGYLRVATTKGHVPDPNVESAISILAETPSGALTRVGAITKIAPGEDIRAVRFDGERGYVVTFKKTDPLFVIDTLEPQRPKILGELEIPGFSTYLHRIDADHLLSIGFDANDHGDFAYFDGVILQLFDVKNPTEPKLLHKEKIGTRGSSSEAATDHLAFNYMPSRGLLAIPMTVCSGGGDGTFGDKLAFSGLLVYGVDIDHGFKRLGGVDHGAKGATCGTWWSQARSQVKRSVFLDDLVYSIADDRVKVQSLEHLGRDVADLPISN